MFDSIIRALCACNPGCPAFLPLAALPFFPPLPLPPLWRFLLFARPERVRDVQKEGLLAGGAWPLV